MTRRLSLLTISWLIKMFTHIIKALAALLLLNSCHDADDERLEACRGYPCYDKGLCYQASAQKYDMERGCRLGTEEVNCLEEATSSVLIDQLFYSPMMRSGDDKHCWLFQNTIPVDNNWSTDTTPWCSNILQIQINDCQ